jgi:hypothetical protein
MHTTAMALPIPSDISWRRISSERPSGTQVAE